MNLLTGANLAMTTFYLDQDLTLVANFIDVQNPYQDLISINEINYNSSDDFDPGD